MHDLLVDRRADAGGKVIEALERGCRSRMAAYEVIGNFVQLHCRHAGMHAPLQQPHCRGQDLAPARLSFGRGQAFFAGNRRFITRKLWGIANQHAFGHHGQYTTLREAVLAHAGEAAPSTSRLVSRAPRPPTSATSDWPG